MGLETKDAPRQLERTYLDCVWPGDSAVDVQKSDIEQWCRTCGQDGLQLIADEVPDVIRISALSDQAYGRVEDAMVKGFADGLYAAFRYGVVSIKSGEKQNKLGTKIRDNGLLGLADSAMRALGEMRMELPVEYADVEMLRAQHGDERAQEYQDDRGDGMRELSDVSLVRMLGRHVLALTFRLRG